MEAQELQDTKELTTCKFLDEFMDYTVRENKKKLQEDEESILFLSLDEQMEFLPDDIESTCDFTITE